MTAKSTKTKAAALFLAATTSLLASSGGKGADLSAEQRQQLKPDTGISIPVVINNNTSLYTVNDPRFICQLTINRIWNNVATGLDCGLTEKGKNISFSRETIKIGSNKELYIIPGPQGPTFVAADTGFSNVGASVSAPGLHR